jgi:hypothetical protein
LTFATSPQRSPIAFEIRRPVFARNSKNSRWAVAALEAADRFAA